MSRLLTTTPYDIEQNTFSFTKKLTVFILSQKYEIQNHIQKGCTIFVMARGITELVLTYGRP